MGSKIKLREHIFIEGRKPVECRVCGRVWLKIPSSQCPGLPYYTFEERPPYFLTTSEMMEQRLKPTAGPVGCYYLLDRHKYAPLYDATESKPIRRRKLSEDFEPEPFRDFDISTKFDPTFLQKLVESDEGS